MLLHQIIDDLITGLFPLHLVLLHLLVEDLLTLKPLLLQILDEAVLQLLILDTHILHPPLHDRQVTLQITVLGSE